MALEDFATVDLVTRLPGSIPRAALVISDNGLIMSDGERETALQRKLSSYMFFVQSGQFREQYPMLAEMELSVEVVCSSPPTRAMKEIGCITHPDDPEFSLAVFVSEEAEFRTRLGLEELQPKI
jgi:hypothetical protein